MRARVCGPTATSRRAMVMRSTTSNAASTAWSRQPTDSVTRTAGCSFGWTVRTATCPGPPPAASAGYPSSRGSTGLTLPGQELATNVALSVWNYQVVRGFELHRPPAKRPLQAPRHVVDSDTVAEAWPRDPVVKDLLDSLNWPALLQRRPNWSYDDATGEIVCEDDRRLVLTTVRRSSKSPTTTGLIFRRPTGGCEECSSRPRCLTAPGPWRRSTSR